VICHAPTVPIKGSAAKTQKRPLFNSLALQFNRGREQLIQKFTHSFKILEMLPVTCGFLSAFAAG